MNETLVWAYIEEKDEYKITIYNHNKEIVDAYYLEGKDVRDMAAKGKKNDLPS